MRNLLLLDRFRKPVPEVQTEQVAPSSGSKSKTKVVRKTVAMYLTMVFVSTFAIFFLEHVAIVNAFRTALVAAVGKTLAANWVSSAFE